MNRKMVYCGQFKRRLDQLLTAYHNQLCADPHVLIYGLLGIAHFARRELKPVSDYSKAMRVVYREAAIAIIAAGLNAQPFNINRSDWEATLRSWKLSDLWPFHLATTYVEHRFEIRTLAELLFRL